MVVIFFFTNGTHWFCQEIIAKYYRSIFCSDSALALVFVDRGFFVSETGQKTMFIFDLASELRFSLRRGSAISTVIFFSPYLYRKFILTR